MTRLVNDAPGRRARERVADAIEESFKDSVSWRPPKQESLRDLKREVEKKKEGGDDER